MTKIIIYFFNYIRTTHCIYIPLQHTLYVYDNVKSLNLHDIMINNINLHVMKLFLAISLLSIIIYIGSTALMWAAYNGHTEVASLLIERGASIEIQDKDGESEDMIIQI